MSAIPTLGQNPRRCTCQESANDESACCANCVYGTCPGCTFPNDIDCRRHGPIGERLWPRVHRSDWCGDYTAAESREALLTRFIEQKARTNEFALRAYKAEGR